MKNGIKGYNKDKDKENKKLNSINFYSFSNKEHSIKKSKIFIKINQKIGIT
jgi:hypothetical protein